MKALIGVVGALVAVSLGGCGTVCNLAGGIVHPESEPRVYGGVVRDLEIIDQAISSPPPSEPIGDPRLALVILPLAVADPILSFVGDTLTLPITVPLQKRRKAAEDRPADGGGRNTVGPVGTATLRRPHPPDLTSEDAGAESDTGKPAQPE
jgi:hypothetical protein